MSSTTGLSRGISGEDFPKELHFYPFAPSPPYPRRLMLSTSTAVGTRAESHSVWWEHALSLRWGRMKKKPGSLRKGVGKGISGV